MLRAITAKYHEVLRYLARNHLNDAEYQTRTAVTYVLNHQHKADLLGLQHRLEKLVPMADALKFGKAEPKEAYKLALAEALTIVYGATNTDRNAYEFVEQDGQVTES